jgi:NDP-sugar pyrophosphorylase family protein
MDTKNTKKLNIVIPMAGGGRKFQEAGYAFPKPLIDMHGKTMIEVVTHNVKPTEDHTFIFICQREHYTKYDLHNILKNATNNKFEVTPIVGKTAGAACTVLCAIQYIDNDSELIIANSDQVIDFNMDDFLKTARSKNSDGLIMTFQSNHPKWSYARVGSNGLVLETAEKKVISNNATAGVYYFKHGKDFVEGAKNMIHKGCHYNGEYYVCPVFNELILKGKKIYTYPIDQGKMHGLGTPEEVKEYLDKKQ